MHITAYRLVRHVEVPIRAVVPALAPEFRSIPPYAVRVRIRKAVVSLPRHHAVGQALVGRKVLIFFQVDVAQPDTRPRIDVVERILIAGVHRAEVSEILRVCRDSRRASHSRQLRQALVPTGGVMVLIDNRIECVHIKRIRAAVAFLNSDRSNRIPILLLGAAACDAGNTHSILCRYVKGLFGSVRNRNRNGGCRVSVILLRLSSRDRGNGDTVFHRYCKLLLCPIQQRNRNDGFAVISVNGWRSRCDLCNERAIQELLPI